MLINDESLGCDSGLRKDRSTTGEGDVDRGLDTPPTYAGSIEYVYYGKCTGYVYLKDDALTPGGRTHGSLHTYAVRPRDGLPG